MSTIDLSVEATENKHNMQRVKQDTFAYQSQFKSVTNYLSYLWWVCKIWERYRINTTSGLHKQSKFTYPVSVRAPSKICFLD